MEEMIKDIQSYLGDSDFTAALIHILLDWEKMRYLPEKRRLMELAQLRFHILVDHGAVHDQSKSP